jgi:hypothetical protein
MISRTFAIAWGVSVRGVLFSVSWVGAVVVAMFLSKSAEKFTVTRTLLLRKPVFKLRETLSNLLDATGGTWSQSGPFVCNAFKCREFLGIGAMD